MYDQLQDNISQSNREQLLAEINNLIKGSINNCWILHYDNSANTIFAHLYHQMTGAFKGSITIPATYLQDGINPLTKETAMEQAKRILDEIEFTVNLEKALTDDTTR